MWNILYKIATSTIDLICDSENCCVMSRIMKLVHRFFDYTFCPCFFSRCRFPSRFAVEWEINCLSDWSLMKGKSRSSCLFHGSICRCSLANYCFPRPLEHKSTHVTSFHLPPITRIVASRELRDFNGSRRHAESSVHALTSRFSIRFHRWRSPSATVRIKAR